MSSKLPQNCSRRSNLIIVLSALNIELKIKNVSEHKFWKWELKRYDLIQSFWRVYNAFQYRS